MSSSDSTKAQIFKEYIVKNHKNIKLYIPNIADKFTEAIPQLNKLIEESNSNEMVFMGSSLGGFFATHYAECFKFCSYRLRNKKDFVMQALKYAGPEYDQIGEKLKNDFDILKSFKISDFSK